MKIKSNNFKLNIGEATKDAQNILIVGHVRPDGDCLGSGLALKRFLEKNKKNVDFVCDSDLPSHYSFLPDFESVNNQKFANYNLVICVDCADTFRMGKYAGYIKKTKSINIDHHVTNDGFANLNLVLPKYSSTCEIITELLAECNALDKETAFYLFCGLSTDTGHFMHSNTDSRSLSTAAKLAEFGININEIATYLYRNNTLEKTKLIARAINSMRFFHSGEICIITVTLKDLEECGCVLSDTEGLTDYGMNIGKVKVTVCLTEQTRPQYKVSFRSKSVDVAAAASVFGGGGHKMASGCVVSGAYEDVISKLVKSITDGMSD